MVCGVLSVVFGAWCVLRDVCCVLCVAWFMVCAVCCVVRAVWFVDCGVWYVCVFVCVRVGCIIENP